MQQCSTSKQEASFTIRPFYEAIFFISFTVHLHQPGNNKWCTNIHSKCYPQGTKFYLLPEKDRQKVVCSPHGRFIWCLDDNLSVHLERIHWKMSTKYKRTSNLFYKRTLTLLHIQSDVCAITYFLLGTHFLLTSSMFSIYKDSVICMFHNPNTF